MYQPKHIQPRSSRQQRSQETERRETRRSQETEERRETRRTRSQDANRKENRPQSVRTAPHPTKTQEKRRPYSPDQYSYPLTREEQEARRSGSAEAQRLRKHAKRKKRAGRILPLLLAAVLLVTGACAGTVFLLRALFDRHPHREEEASNTLSGVLDSEPPPEEELLSPSRAEPVTSVKTVFRPTPEIVRIDGGDEAYSSGYMILVDLDAGTILAEKNGWTTIHPASMTKIMTLLVIAEQVKDLTGSAVVSQETINYCIEHDCTVAGFAPGEEVPVMDLLYGVILPSGADAALTLAEYAAGSQTEFVRLMNQKAEDLGVARTTHFANCIGLYDESNVSTPYDMAVILNAAMKNGLCRMVLGERIYDIPASPLHEKGISLSNWFIRRIEDHMPEGVVVKGAKTGFINEAGNCAASLAEDTSGHACICVTAMAGSVWQCVYDHVALYENFGFAS